MKKENLTNQLGWAYFWLTITVVLLGAYLKLVGEINISWWWITSPAWGSTVGSLLILGVSHLIIKIWKL